jgi:hypothetical protein
MTDTNTAVATTEQQRPPKPPAMQAGGTISAMIPTDIDQAFRLARAIAMSGMAPKAYGQDENKCFVGILAGAEVGFAPMQALQSIAVINGNPSIWGDGALALVQASGLLESIEETDDGQEATCRVVRKGWAPIIRTFSMKDAQDAKLLAKDGPWKTYPKRMRQMRARSWALRDGFADVLKGLHIAEEVRDRPEQPEAPQTMRLSSDMLAAQAGVTVEQATVAEDRWQRMDQGVQERIGAEQVQDAEVEDVAEQQHEDKVPDQLSPEAQQALDDIDGPIDEPEQADEGPDPREAIAADLIAKVDKCTTIIDLRALHEREQQTIEALPEDLAARVTDAFNVMREALKRKNG